MEEGEPAVADTPPAPAKSEAKQRKRKQTQRKQQQREKERMPQECIERLLASEHKPLRLSESMLKRIPMLAEVYRGHEEARAVYAAHQDRVRREYESRGFVELPDDDGVDWTAWAESITEAVFNATDSEEPGELPPLPPLKST